MSIDPGKVLALAERVAGLAHMTLGKESREEREAIERELRALAQPAEAVEGDAASADGKWSHERIDSIVARLRDTGDHEAAWLIELMRQAGVAAEQELLDADAAQGAVAWRFFVGHSNSWLYEGWTGWTTDAAFRELCERQGFRAEFAYPANHPQAAPAQGPARRRALAGG